MANTRNVAKARRNLASLLGCTPPLLPRRDTVDRVRPHRDHAPWRALELLDLQRLPARRMHLALDPAFVERLVAEEADRRVAEEVRATHCRGAVLSVPKDGWRLKLEGWVGVSVPIFRLPSSLSNPVA